MTRSRIPPLGMSYNSKQAHNFFSAHLAEIHADNMGVEETLAGLLLIVCGYHEITIIVASSWNQLCKLRRHPIILHIPNGTMGR